MRTKPNHHYLILTRPFAPCLALRSSQLNKLKHIQQFIKSHHFPEKIRARIKKYYELHFNYLKRELHMLDELSPALRHECMHHIYFKILSKVPFLRDSPQIVQSAVIANVKPVLCCAKDYLVIEGQVRDEIYLRSGRQRQRHRIVINTNSVASLVLPRSSTTFPSSPEVPSR